MNTYIYENEICRYMKWACSVENKIKASITLLLLIGVVFFSNYRLKRLSGKVANSVQTIYEDRLLVQNMIFSYSNILNNIYYRERPYSEQEFVALEMSVDTLNSRYLGTVLTDEEGRIFESFSDNLKNTLGSRSNLDFDLYRMMKSQLQRLEEIQLEEAQSQMLIIEKVKFDQQQVFYVETIIMIILLLIVQVLITSNESMKKIIKKDNINWN